MAKENKVENIETNCENCSRYLDCSAPLCPLDEELADRIWYADEEDDEEICLSQKYSKDARWIKKQRSIMKNKTKSWFGKATKYQDLVDASRPPKISEEAMKERRERMRKLQEARKAKREQNID